MAPQGKQGQSRPMRLKHFLIRCILRKIQIKPHLGLEHKCKPTPQPLVFPCGHGHPTGRKE